MVVVDVYANGVVVVPDVVLSTSVSAFWYVNESPTANGNTTVASGVAAAGRTHARETSALSRATRTTVDNVIVDLQENMRLF
jgi:hypothetical protein